MLRAKWRIVAELTGMLLVCAALFAQTDSPASKTTSSKPKTATTHKSATASKPASKSTSASHTNHSMTAKTKSASSSTSSRRGKKSKKTAKRGQQKIDSERTEQIQEALIKQHYLSGEPTGKWDPATEDALRKFQADNGWQNKTVPDSRALIKLGLGPSHDHLLNPESAMTTVPETASTPTAANRPVAHDSGPSPTQPQQ
jgi:peptidoglycan hydrolase-like protein with peptidoglycan-binding domain